MPEGAGDGEGSGGNAELAAGERRGVGRRPGLEGPDGDAASGRRHLAGGTTSPSWPLPPNGAAQQAAAAAATRDLEQLLGRHAQQVVQQQQQQRQQQQAGAGSAQGQAQAQGQQGRRSVPSIGLSSRPSKTMRQLAVPSVEGGVIPQQNTAAFDATAALAAADPAALLAGTGGVTVGGSGGSGGAVQPRWATKNYDLVSNPVFEMNTTSDTYPFGAAASAAW